MEYIVNHIPRSAPHNRRPGIPMTARYITIHSTGNSSSTAHDERMWLVNTSNTETASWHIAVDEKEAIEAIPLNEVAWHAGDGNGAGNRQSISIEICESGDRAKTLENAVILTAKLLKQHGWGVDRLRRHHDWSGKICPRIMAENNWAGWAEFKKALVKELVKLSTSARGGSMTQAQQDKNKPSPWAKEAWEWARQERLLDGTRPRDNITREELAIVLKRLVDKK